MDRLIGIIRNGDALTARWVRQNICLNFFESPGVDEQAASEAGDWYEIIERPVNPREPVQARLLASWEALRHVQELDEETFSHLRVILNATVLGHPPQSALSPLAPMESPPEKRVNPTAAHPRAYHGTKHKPPKEKTPPALDLQSYLCDTKFLSSLPMKETAEAAAQARLPKPFRLSLYPLVRHRPEAEITDMLALYWELALEHHPAQLAAVAYLLRLQSDANARRWCRMAAGLPEEWRTPFLHLLIASGAHTEEVQGLPPTFPEHLAEVTSGPTPIYRLYWLLNGLAIGIAPDYLLSGFRLANRYRREYDFHDVRRSDYFPEAAALALWEHFQNDTEFSVWSALNLWRRCGEREGLGELFEILTWTRYQSDVADRYLHLYAGYGSDDDLPEEQAAVKWRFVRQQATAMDDLLRSVPEAYQLKCIEHLRQYLWQWDTLAELEANFPTAIVLTKRLAQPPFDIKCDLTEATTDFLAELTPILRERFLRAPDISFRRLEQACRRENDTWLIGRGTWTLTKHQGEFSIHCFETDPARLFKITKLLGCLPGPVREEVVRTMTEMHTQNSDIGLKMLEQAVLSRLAEGFPIEAQREPIKHALKMQRLITDNRRALRRFLQAYWGGQTNYLRDHLLTQDWLARHPRLDLNLWLGGVSYQQSLEEFGLVSLTVEQDPLEALKLGTYVGSCLGLGGSFTYSAAAVVLDINKQVVYARNARGTVLARQVIALAENDRLVCYDVYPLSAKPELQKMFAEYDRALSQSLSLPLYDTKSVDGYQIAHILSHEWWDDYAWNLKTEK